jgi:hypothetical protein
MKGFGQCNFRAFYGAFVDGAPIFVNVNVRNCGNRKCTTSNQPVYILCLLKKTNAITI